MTTIVALAGNLARPSRTRSAAGAALALAARRTGAGTGLIDLPDFGPALGAARRIEDLDAPGRALVESRRMDELDCFSVLSQSL